MKNEGMVLDVMATHNSNRTYSRSPHAMFFLGEFQVAVFQASRFPVSTTDKKTHKQQSKMAAKSLLQGLADKVKCAREYALLGNYGTALKYFEIALDNVDAYVRVRTPPIGVATDTGYTLFISIIAIRFTVLINQQL